MPGGSAATSPPGRSVLPSSVGDGRRVVVALLDVGREGAFLDGDPRLVVDLLEAVPDDLERDRIERGRLGELMRSTSISRLPLSADRQAAARRHERGGIELRRRPADPRALAPGASALRSMNARVGLRASPGEPAQAGDAARGRRRSTDLPGCAGAGARAGTRLARARAAHVTIATGADGSTAHPSCRAVGTLVKRALQPSLVEAAGSPPPCGDWRSAAQCNGSGRRSATSAGDSPAVRERDRRSARRACQRPARGERAGRSVLATACETRRLQRRVRQVAPDSSCSSSAAASSPRRREDARVVAGTRILPDGQAFGDVDRMERTRAAEREKG